MRELKFRIWVKDEERYYDETDEESYQIIPNGQVTYTSEAYEEDGAFYTDTTNATDNVVVEQYTGLKDRYGEPIYEGDIIKYAWTRCNYIVAYRKYDASFVLENDDREEIICFQYNRQNDYEVIGTIHENPELLEEVGDERQG